MEEGAYSRSINRKVSKDTKGLAKHMTEKEGSTHKEGVGSGRLLKTELSVTGATSRQEETPKPCSPDLLTDEGSRHQTPENLFDLTKGRFTCYCK
jgi:hypothetical protein